MNTLDEQLALIQAHMVQRSIQCRSAQTKPDRWREISKDHVFNFQKFHYRVTPVSAECWMVWDHVTQKYINGDSVMNTPFENGQEATKAALTWCEDAEAAGRYEPVLMVPKHAP
jgi:hypothetical protein